MKGKEVFSFNGEIVGSTVSENLNGRFTELTLYKKHSGYMLRVTGCSTLPGEMQLVKYVQGEDAKEIRMILRNAKNRSRSALARTLLWLAAQNDDNFVKGVHNVN